MSYARILYVVCAMFVASQLALAANQAGQQPGRVQQDQHMQQMQQMQTQSGQPMVSSKADLSADLINVLQQTDEARQAVRFGNKQLALTNINSALSHLDQADVIAQRENLGSIVPIFAEFGTIAVIGPVQVAKAQTGQPGAAQQPLTDEAQLYQTPVVRGVEAEYTDLAINLDSARTHLEAARGAIQNNDLATAESALTAVQSDVMVRSAEVDMPLVTARLNLALAEQHINQGNYGQAIAPLQEASDALATYSGPHTQEVGQIQNDLTSLLQNYDQLRQEAAQRVHQMWNQLAELTTPGQQQGQTRPLTDEQTQQHSAMSQSTGTPHGYGSLYGYAPYYRGFYNYRGQPYAFAMPKYTGYYYYDGRYYYSPNHRGYYSFNRGEMRHDSGRTSGDLTSSNVTPSVTSPSISTSSQDEQARFVPPPDSERHKGIRSRLVDAKRRQPAIFFPPPDSERGASVQSYPYAMGMEPQTVPSHEYGQPRVDTPQLQGQVAPGPRPLTDEMMYGDTVTPPEFQNKSYAPMYRGYVYRDSAAYLYVMPSSPGYYYFDGRGYYKDEMNENRFRQGTQQAPMTDENQNYMQRREDMQGQPALPQTSPPIQQRNEGY
ncbi:MAG: tetratricopeptide repeat protein [bacterium]